MRPDWIRRQLVDRGIQDERVLDAMASVPREVFVGEEAHAAAYADEALSIGHGQTISQPYMVARICEELGLRGDELVLDVGTGSGYQAAVLGRLGRAVHSIERIPELAERARLALGEAGAANVEVHIGDGSLGLPEHALFGAIAVAAAAPEIPEALVAQLEQGGRLAVPVGSAHDQQLLVVLRTPHGAEVVRSVPCRFVPLLGAGGFPDAAVVSTPGAQDRTSSR
jgi:protein-L-isoaspartate(D-aspartate) O-methyltransferase